MQTKSLCTDDSCKKDIETYSDMVYKLAFSLVKNEYDADDVYQDVFYQYIRKRPDFSSEEHKKAWLLRVTINRCKNFFNTAWMLKVMGLQKDSEKVEERMQTPSAEDEALKAEQNDLIEVVKTLPYKYRVVIHLFYYEDLSVEEISRALKKKPSTVRTQLTRARALLREIIKEESYVS